MTTTGAPMPAALRATLRTVRHPAQATPCPHCRASVGRSCTTVSGRRTLAAVHHGRIVAHARRVAACCRCDAQPGHPCHDDGNTRHDTVHAERHLAAEETS
ncbi:zinc finger domain-containing protein [Streptomyces albidoflavus]|uniref:zinc finger domain-containing protein n=1 Tax=Streptomyces albidoflavus TaxID=1886 RepID=UPI00101F7F65|nr:hypothetical protein [Streptomyces albidoflavus]RZF05995.1 hypothetical protein C0R05_24490 [Streptomyces albidoflavus]